jgi:hypothetical protein
MMLAFVCLIYGLPRDPLQIRYHHFRRRRGRPMAYREGDLCTPSTSDESRFDAEAEKQVR